MHNNHRLVFRWGLTKEIFRELPVKSVLFFQSPWLKRDASGTRKTPMWREIALTLTVKLLLLYGLWYLFFSHPALHSMTEGMNPDRVAATLIAAPK